MRKLSRSLALAAALTLTGLTVQASAATYGECFVRCQGSGFPPVTYTLSLTQQFCCSGSIPDYCPAGSHPVPFSWNGSRCGA